MIDIAGIQVSGNVDINELAKLGDIAAIEAAVLGDQGEAVDTGQGEAQAEATETADRGDDGKKVLGPDGKGYIPYGVHKQLRHERRQALEQAEQAKEREEQERQARIKAEAELAAYKAGKTTEADGTPKVLSDETLALLEQDDPLLAELAHEVKAIRGDREKEARERKAQAERERQEAMRAEQEAVDAAIDAVPTMAYLRTLDASVWDAAVTVDESLRKSPVWARKPMEERFAEVARRVVDDYGINVPAEYLSSGDLEDKAKTAAKAAKPARVDGIGDLAGGIPPDTGLDVQNASPVQIGVQAMNMTRAQQEAFLARFA